MRLVRIITVALEVALRDNDDASIDDDDTTIDDGDATVITHARAPDRTPRLYDEVKMAESRCLF